MVQEITRETLPYLRNPVFREYAAMYLDIYDGFVHDVEELGLPFHRDPADLEQTKALREQLKAIPEIYSRCEGASLVYKRISSACEICRLGVGTITSHISFKCHRNCFFCFNPNQDNYEEDLTPNAAWKRELEEMKMAGEELSHIALTGGEPLLHPEESVAFFALARSLYPSAHLRLYTSGDLLTEDLAVRLKDAGLDEIRFSCKMEDTPEMQEKVLSRIAMAKDILPCVMVEMPVMPDKKKEMEALLMKLDEIGVWCINLLELCFPFHNAEAFLNRGYFLKYPPYQTLYNFWYAGGLPIAGSELLALKLMRFAARKNLTMGVHYCSLENKNFGQIYRQNNHPSLWDATQYFSERDFYLKTIKAFGSDANQVKDLFDQNGMHEYRYNKDGEFIQFHPTHAALLKDLPVELALSINVMENRDGEIVTRELKLLRISASDCETDIL